MYVPDRAAATSPLSCRLRTLLDENVVTGITLREAAQELDAHPDSLVRAFARAYGLPPRRYLTRRRVDLARRLLLEGMPAVDVAPACGFHDQAHLARHFARVVGTTPGRFRASSERA